MKKYYIFLTIFCLLTLNAFAWDGEGTIEKPYKLSTSQDIVELSAQINYKQQFENIYFIITNDMDMSGVKDFIPIGTSSYAFKGNLNGQNYQIKNLKVKNDGYNKSYYALFGHVSGGTIENIKITGSSYIEADINAAAIIAKLGNGTIRNCHSSATIIGINKYSQYLGGIVGYASSSVIENCTNSGTIFTEGESSSYIGGIVGSTSGCYVINCSNTGNITGSKWVGGVAGSIGSSDSIKNCNNKGFITGSDDYIGGITGFQSIGLIETAGIFNCYNAGEIKGINYVGGIAGKTANTQHSCNIGKVEGRGKFTGGITGEGTLYSCYNTGLVNGNLEVGGIVGSVMKAYNCYNRGNVSGASIVGGIGGNMSGTENELKFNYNTGKISATNASPEIGGVIGKVNTGGFINNNIILNCYWNTETYAGNGSGDGNLEAGCFGKNTSYMKNEMLPILGSSNWLQDHQNKNNGYPVLSGEIAAVLPVANTIYTITTSAGENGTVTLLGGTKVASGSTLVFLVTPDEKYVIDKIMVGNENYGNDSIFCVENILSDHTISITFKLKNESGFKSQTLDNIICKQLNKNDIYLENILDSNLTIIDMNGRQLFSKENTNNIELVDLKNYQSGIYMIKRKKEKVTKTFKIIK